MKENAASYGEQAAQLKKQGKQPHTPNDHMIKILYNTRRLPAPYAGARMLDVGCYDGGTMIAFAKTGYEVYGADIAAEELDLSRFNVERAGFTPGGFAMLSDKDQGIGFDDDMFDMLVCWKVIYWTGSAAGAEALLKEMFRVLRPGGGIVISTFENDANHLVISQNKGGGLYLYPRPDGAWIDLFHYEDANDFVALMRRVGYTGVRIGSTVGDLLHEPGTPPDPKGRQSFRIFYAEKPAA